MEGRQQALKIIDIFAGKEGVAVSCDLDELQSCWYNLRADASTSHPHVTLAVGSNYEARTLGPMVKKSPERDLWGHRHTKPMEGSRRRHVVHCVFLGGVHQAQEEGFTPIQSTREDRASRHTKILRLHFFWYLDHHATWCWSSWHNPGPHYPNPWWRSGQATSVLPEAWPAGDKRHYKQITGGRSDHPNTSSLHGPRLEVVGWYRILDPWITPRHQTFFIPL